VRDVAHEVGGSTYETVGPTQLYDERENVFSRESLLPGSSEEREYHVSHPELKKIDHRLARYFFDEVGASGVIAEKAPSGALPESSFRAVSAPALPDAVDGPVAPRKVRATPWSNLT
jgi:hypothetical protein